MMCRLGYANSWVKLVMLFVKSVRYTIVNARGSISPINPSRGLRQRDPLSPYLFLICAEGLLAILHDPERRGLIQGVRL